MIKTIGNVVLDYSFYDNNDIYSDGEEEEEELLKICMEGKIESEVHRSSKWTVLYHLSDLRENIIEWYPIEKNAEILEIGSGCGAISGALCKKAKSVLAVELSERRSMINAYKNIECQNLKILVGNFKNIEFDKKFDYITMIGVFEYAANYIGGDTPYIDFIKKIQSLLKPNGKIIIAIENKMGLKYLNGACEDHLGRPFAGIEDYRSSKKIRTFSKQELCDVFLKCEINNYNFYYPSPDYKLPISIYSDEHLPQCGEIRTWGTNYDTYRISFFNEAITSDQICKDQMYDYFSNSFMVVCNESKSDIIYCKYNNLRRKEYQTRTTIVMENEKKSVLKTYLWDVSRTYNIFETMGKYYKLLQQEFLNVTYLPVKFTKSSLESDYIDGITLDVFLAKYTHNLELLINEFKLIIKKFYKCNSKDMQEFIPSQEYEQIFGNLKVVNHEKSLRVTNIDMLLHNLIMSENAVFCIDYEWVYTFPIPYEFVIYRCIVAFYQNYSMYFMNEIDRNSFLIKIGVKQNNIEIYDYMNKKFYENVFGKNEHNNYLKNYRKGAGTIGLKI